MKRVIFVALLVMLISGCSHQFSGKKPSVSTLRYPGQHFQPSTTIEVFHSRIPRRDYIKIGEVSIHYSADDVILRLKEKAKTLGGNALILMGERRRGGKHPLLSRPTGTLGGRGLEMNLDDSQDWWKKEAYGIVIKYK